MLQLENIKLFFMENALNITLQKGEILGVLGSSGSGKTSLLKSIKGFFPREKGDVILNGEVINQSTDCRIGFIHQQSFLFPHWSVEKNLTFPDKYVRKSDPTQTKERLKVIVEAFDLNRAITKSVRDLSVGEKQRLAIARCLMMSPQVVLMDEPSSALDPVNVKKLYDIIAKLKSINEIFIISSHDMHLIKSLCDKIVFLSNGRIIFNGTAEEFWNSQNPIIQEFNKYLPTI